MASDQWNGFHHAPHPDDEEDDDWYYDDEPDYHHQLADQHLARPPSPAPHQHQSTNMLHYQSFAQPAPQPKVKVDMSRIAYASWQNPWQSAPWYQNQGARHSAYGGYSACDYQGEDEDEDQDEEYASSGIDEVAGETDDSVYANAYDLDQEEQMVAAPQPPPAAPGPSQVAVPPPPPPAPVPARAFSGPEGDVVVVPPPPPVAPIQIISAPLPPGITVPSSPSSGKSVHFPDGLEDPKGTSIQKGKKILNRKASLSNLKDQLPPKPIVPLVQKREHKGLTWKEQQERRRQDHEKRREALRQQALKWIEAAKKKREEDAEKSKKKAEEDAIKAKRKAEEAKKKKELEAERAKKKAELIKKRKELEAKKKKEAKEKAEETRKKLAAKKSALKKGKSTKDAGKDGGTEPTSDGGDVAAEESGDAPPPAPDPPTETEEVTKSDSPSDDAPVEEPSSGAAGVAEVPLPLSPSSDHSACVSTDPSADERVDAPAETTSQVEALVDDDPQQEETQAQQSELPPDDCPVEPEDRVTSNPSQGGQDGQEEGSGDDHGPESLGQGEGESQGDPEPEPEPQPSGCDNVADQALDESSKHEVVKQNDDEDMLQVEIAESPIENKPPSLEDGAPPEPPQPPEDLSTLEEPAMSHVDIPDESPTNNVSAHPSPLAEAKPASDDSCGRIPDEATAIEDSEGQHPQDLSPETNEMQHVDDDCCSECRAAVSGDVVSSENPVEDEITQDHQMHEDGNMELTNDILAGGEGEQVNDHEEFSQSDPTDVEDVNGTESLPGNGPGDQESSLELQSEHERIPEHPAMDDSLEIPNYQPSQVTAQPDQFIEGSKTQDDVPLSDGLPASVSGGQDEDIAPSLPLQDACESLSPDEQTQSMESGQGEESDGASPPAPDAAPIDDQSPPHGHVDDTLLPPQGHVDATPLPPQEASEQPPKEISQSDGNGQSDSTPPAATNTPTDNDPSEPVAEKKTGVPNQASTDESVPVESSIADEDGTTATSFPDMPGKHSASDSNQYHPYNEGKGDSVPLAAPDAANADGQGQEKDQESSDATEQQPSPDNVDEVHQSQEGNEPESALPAAPEIPSSDDRSAQLDLEDSATDGTLDKTGGEGGSTEYAGEDEKHEASTSSQETPGVSDAAIDAQDDSSKENVKILSESGGSQQENHEEYAESHDGKPQDEKLEEIPDDPSTASGGKEISSLPDATEDVPDASANSAGSTTEILHDSGSSQDPNDAHDGAEDCPEQSNTTEPPEKIGDAEAVGESRDGTNDSGTTDPPLELNDSKPPAGEVQNHQSTDEAQENEESANSQEAVDNSPNDPDSEEKSGEDDSTPQKESRESRKSSGDDIQTPAGERSAGVDGGENATSNEPTSSGDVEHETGKDNSEAKESPDGSSSSGNVETQQGDSKSSPLPEVNENGTTPESEKPLSPPNGHQDKSTREDLPQRPDSPEDQPLEASAEPESVQENKEAAESDAAEPTSEPPGETTPKVEEPHFTESDYRIMEEIMNPPAPPPEPEPEPKPKPQPQPESAADQPDQASQESENVTVDSKSDNGPQEACPNMDSPSAPEIGAQVAESSGESYGQHGPEGDEIKPEASPNDSELSESKSGDGSEAKLNEEVQRADQESATTTPTDNATPTDERNKPTDDGQDQAKGQDRVPEKEADDVPAVNSTQEKSQGEDKAADDGQALDDQNQSDLSSENEDALSIASSTVAAVGDKADESQTESEASESDIESLAEELPPSSSSEPPPGENEAVPEPSSSQQVLEPKPEDDAVDSSVHKESPNEEIKMTSTENDAAESDVQSPEPSANESSVQEPPDHSEKAGPEVIDSSAIERQSSQVESGESTGANEDSVTAEELSQEDSAQAGDDSQLVAQATSKAHPASNAANDSPEMASQESSDPPSEDTTDAPSKASASGEQESESLAESDSKDSGSSANIGSADTAPTEDSAQSDSKEDSGEGAPEKIDVADIGQPFASDSPPAQEGGSDKDQGESSNAGTVPINENAEESKNNVEAAPETRDEKPDPPPISEEQHGESNDNSAQDLPVDSAPSDESKEDKQHTADPGENGEEALPKDGSPVASPVENAVQEGPDEVIGSMPDTQTFEKPGETGETTGIPEVTIEEVKNPMILADVEEVLQPDGDAMESPTGKDANAVDEPSASEDQSPVSEKQPESSAPVGNEPTPAILETSAPPGTEKKPEASAEQHHSEAPAQETPPAESVPEQVDDLPPSPSDPHKERKHRRRSSVSYHEYPYVRRHSTTSTGKGSYTMSSSSRDQAPPILRRTTIDKGFRRASIPVETVEDGVKYENGESRHRRRKERRRSHVPADLDDDEARRRRRNELREREAAEVEEARLRAEQAAAELKMRELAQAERERRERHEAKKAAAKREKLRQLEEEARLQEQERLRQEAHKRLEEEKLKRRMDREAQKLREAEEVQRQKLEELEREEARKQRKRERRHRDRERQMSMAEGDGYPPAIPPQESAPLPEVVKEEAIPPKPRRRRTEDVNTSKPRAASPPPKRQSLMGGLFGLSRSITEPAVYKTVDKEKPRAKDQPVETSRRPSAVHRSSSYRKHHRTPSEERRHQQRKAKRRTSKAATNSLDEAPALHDPIPDDAPVDVAPREPVSIPNPSSPVQEEVEPTSPHEPESEVQLPPPLQRATTSAGYGQTERDIDVAAAEPGSSHGCGSSDQRKHHHRRRREHHEGNRERDRERHHHQRRRNSAALDELVGGTSDRREDRGKGRERAADQERDKGKHRSSRVPAEESKRRDSVMESKHRSSGSGRPRQERERERERERQKSKGTSSGGGGGGGGGFFGSLKKLVK